MAKETYQKKHSREGNLRQNISREKEKISAESFEEEKQNTVTAVLLSALLLLTILLGGMSLFSKGNQNLRPTGETPAVPNDTVRLPNEEEHCGEIQAGSERITLRAADGSNWELLPSNTTIRDRLEELDDSQACVISHPAQFPEDYADHRLPILSLSDIIEEDVNPEDDIVTGNDEVLEEFICGLIDISPENTIILKDDEEGETWELLPQDGASDNTLRSREGVKTCIVYDPDSEDQKDLEQNKIHVISAFFIRDPGEVSL